MTNESTLDSTSTPGSKIAGAVVDVMFFGFITLIKVIGCYLYMTIIMSIVAMLTLVVIVFAGLLAGTLFGKLIGVLVGVLIFALVLMGPFSKWMNLIKSAAKREFFGKS